MRKTVVGVMFSGIINIFCIASVHAQHSAGSTIFTITSSASTKVLDSANQPGHWQEAGADETGWNSPTPISGAVRACLAQKNSAWASAPAFWGTNQNTAYLFRWTIFIPKAKNYYDSTLTLATPFLTQVFVNGVEVVLLEPTMAFQHIVIAPYLQSGKNVVAIGIPSMSAPAAQTASGTPCSALSLTATIHANGTPGVHPEPKTLRLTWHRVSRAAYYYLQFWLVKAATGQLVSVDSRSSFSGQTSGTSYSVDPQSLPRGVYQWRAGAMTAQGTLISWTMPQRVAVL